MKHHQTLATHRPRVKRSISITYSAGPLQHLTHPALIQTRSRIPLTLSLPFGPAQPRLRTLPGATKEKMTAHRRLACTIVLTLAAIAPAAFADTLLATFSSSGSATINGDARWQPFISYGNPAVAGAIVMNGVTITPAAVAGGLSFDLTGDFAAISALATNGVDDAMRVGVFAPSGVGFNDTASELAFLNAGTLTFPDIGNPDFAGYTLTRISIRGTSYQTPDGITLNTSTDFSFYGAPASPAVPLPAAACTGLASLAGLKLLTRSRHQASH